MFAWKNTAYGEMNLQAVPMLDGSTAGMVAGTKVATAMGWRRVEAICEGDEVLTFDGGMQTVIAVTRHFLKTDQNDPASWPLSVAKGVLGNRAPMQILPGQAIMIESDMAEECLGDPFAVIPGTSLDGFRGITQSRPEEWVEVIELHFERDEIVFANIGALFLCRAKLDLLGDAAPATYEILPLDQAEILVDYLDVEAARPVTAAPAMHFAAA